MKLQQLIDNANNINAEIIREETMIGIKYKGKHVYHWFDIDKHGEVYFSHSYSQNTGETKRGISHQLTVKIRLGFCNQ